MTAHHPAHGSSPARKLPPHTGLNVLLVEDHTDTADSMAMLLRLAGHQVHVARNGPAALQKAQHSPPNVVILDIGLPGMNGWEVARHLREQAGEKHPFFIAVTGYGSVEDRRRSEEAGIDVHLLKPVEHADLEQILRKIHVVIKN